MDNESIPSINFVLDDSAKLLEYIENSGDYPNSSEAPGLKTAQELYNDLSNYWIIDIRSESEFQQGHIETALNISVKELKVKVDSLISLQPLRKIILVCNNGQASTYYNCILRISGIKNCFSLKYGMASWNEIFAGEWLKALGVAGNIFDYTNDNYPKLGITQLPQIIYPPELQNFEKKIEFRVNRILNESFIEGTQYITELQTDSSENYFIICYGIGRLYFAPSYLPYGELGHPKNAIWFNSNPIYDFRSTKYLQSLPVNRKIIIYSGDGHLSSCITAYLRFLGYDAKTLLFGANRLFYPRMIADPEIVIEAFKANDIMNYPIVTGR